MIETKCFVCDARVVFELDPYKMNKIPWATKYWKVLSNKTVRPYCSPECSLKDYKSEKK